MKYGPLAFARNRLRDAEANAIVLRGVSLFWSNWGSRFYNRQCLEWLHKDWRIDALRIPVAVDAPGGYLDDPGAVMAQVHELAQIAIETGLYVLLDWHSHEPHTDAAACFFEKSAQRFSGTGGVFYELLNEPRAGLSWHRDILPHHETVGHAIRAIDAHAPLLLGTPSSCTRPDVAARRPVNLANVAYTVHFYAGTHREGLRDRMREATRADTSLFVSEWGTAEADGDGMLDLEEAERWLAFLQRRQIGWINWSIHDKAEETAALMPAASPEGRWSKRDLTPSGTFVRRHCRRRRHWLWR